VDEAGRRPPLVERRLESLHANGALQRLAGSPADDAPGAEVDDHGEVKPPSAVAK